MPLPFLRRKQEAGLSTSPAIEHRKPDESPESDQDEGYGLKACAKDLIEAIHSKDEDRVAKVLSDAFEILENQEHEESPLE